MCKNQETTLPSPKLLNYGVPFPSAGQFSFQIRAKSMVLFPYLSITRHFPPAPIPFAPFPSLFIFTSHCPGQYHAREPDKYVLQ